MKRLGLVALIIFAVAVSLHTAIVKKPPNYVVVTNASRNILSGENPYAAQTDLDFFKYSPLAGLFVAPFLYVPNTLGIFFFVVLQLGLFIWAFWRWAARAVQGDGLEPSIVAWVAFFSTVFDVTLSLQNCQVNVGIFALMLLAAAQYTEGKYFRAGVVISLATNLKLFPFTLGLCLLMGFKKRYWAAFTGGLVVWLALPALIIGPESNMRLIGEWIGLMTWDQTRVLDMLDVGSFLALHVGTDPAIRNRLALPVGLIIGLGTLYLFRKGHGELLDRFLLPINGLYVVLFSYLSESPTSVLATAGIFVIAIEALSSRNRARFYWTSWGVALMLIPLFYSDVVPRAWSEWARGFHLKTVGYLYVALVLGHIFYDRYRWLGLKGPETPRIRAVLAQWYSRYVRAR